MTKFDRFLIAPMSVGLETDLRPFLIPDEAFAQLNNAYVFRGRVRKRFGSRFMGSGWSSAQTEPLYSRLRIQVGVTTSGALSGTVPGAIFAVGQQFSVLGQIFTVITTGVTQAMLATGVGTGTYSTTNGDFAITGTAAANNTPVWWYPGQPVMGLTAYSPGDSINNQPSYAFDTQFSYKFAGGFWQRTPSTNAAIWHGGYLNGFWSYNWQGINQFPQIMFTTNFYVKNYDGAGDANDDPIWYYDGTTWQSALGMTYGWYFLPAGGAPYTGPFIQTARLIVPFKNRLVLLNTVENDNSGGYGVNTQYGNRARFCHFGSPFSVNAWYEANQTDNTPTVADGGGYVDAATEEEIISCEFIKDRLIVYFERSTWELAYTGNQVKPFTWQKINTELGSESQFSTVPFDQQVLTIGNTGVHACNGSNVSRIDSKIPQEIFTISNKNVGVQQVAGIRDYYVECVYWCFPSNTENPVNIFPNRVLLYNYQNGSWANNDDCITCFGYFEQQQGMTWASQTITWEQANFSWNSGTVAAQFRQVIAGNQEGFVFIVDAEASRNERAMSITNLTYPAIGVVQLTLINHTLEVEDFITIENPTGINLPIIGSYQVTAIIDANTVNIYAPDVSGTYLGGGNSARVSKIEILSKQWNPYLKDDRNFFLQRIDFGVEKTANGQITVDYYPSATEVSLLEDGAVNGSLMGNGILETSPYPVALAPLEQQQERLWHPLYFQTDGTCIQIYIYLSNDQLSNLTVAWSDFELDGMILYCQPTTARFN